MKNEIIAVITSKTGERVIIGKREVEHALRHFSLPLDIFLELLEKILKDPDEILVDDSSDVKEYRYFYRYINTKYLLAVIKVIPDGAYFASMYSTGNKIRNKHRKFKKLKL